MTDRTRSDNVTYTLFGWTFLALGIASLACRPEMPIAGGSICLLGGLAAGLAWWASFLAWGRALGEAARWRTAFRIDNEKLVQAGWEAEAAVAHLEEAKAALVEETAGRVEAESQLESLQGLYTAVLTQRDDARGNAERLLVIVENLAAGAPADEPDGPEPERDGDTPVFDADADDWAEDDDGDPIYLSDLLRTVRDLQADAKNCDERINDLARLPVPAGSVAATVPAEHADLRRRVQAIEGEFAVLRQLCQSIRPESLLRLDADVKNLGDRLGKLAGCQQQAERKMAETEVALRRTGILKAPTLAAAAPTMYAGGPPQGMGRGPAPGQVKPDDKPEPKE